MSDCEFDDGFNYEQGAIPLVLLLDCSSSMNKMVDNNLTRIDLLNQAVQWLLSDLAKINTLVKVTILPFSSTADFLCKQEPIYKVEANFNALTAQGTTCLYLALNKLNEIIEDTSVFLSSDSKPIVVIVSDGAPTDEYGKPTDEHGNPITNWIQPMKKFLDSPRTSKCIRLALGIGEYASKSACLKMFVGDNQKVESASESSVHDIKKFFLKVSAMTKQVSSAGSFREYPESQTRMRSVSQQSNIRSADETNNYAEDVNMSDLFS